MEPLQFSPYMDECARVLLDAGESDLDVVLVSQAKCHYIMDLTTHRMNESVLGESNQVPSVPLVHMMQSELRDVRRNLPEAMRSNRKQRHLTQIKREDMERSVEEETLNLSYYVAYVLFYLHSADMIIQEALLSQPQAPDPATSKPMHMRHLQAIESVLATVECWLAVFDSLPNTAWFGSTFGIFAQFSHCIAILIRLASLDERGWDATDVKRRADPIAVLDRLIDGLDRLPSLVGLVGDDNSGSGSTGIYFRAPAQMRGLRADIAAELSGGALGAGGAGVESPGEGMSFSLDEPGLFFTDDPWLLDVFQHDV